MRQHFNRGCISHTTPNGKSLFGRKEFLTRKFNAGDISKEELLELAELRVTAYKANGSNPKPKAPKAVVTRMLGKLITVGLAEFKKYYEPYGHTIIEAIY